MHKITAIILAAGLSSRMKEAFKLTLPFKSHTILEEVIIQVIATDIDDIIVVTGHEKEQTTRLLRKYPSLKVVHNKDYGSGMTSSIRCGINAASPKALGYLICLGDLPFVSTEEYLHIMNTFLNLKTAAKIIRPFYKDTPGNPVLFSSNFREELLVHKDSMGCKSLIKKYPSVVHKLFMASDSVIRDIDTQLDYNRLKNINN